MFVVVVVVVVVSTCRVMPGLWWVMVVGKVLLLSPHMRSGLLRLKIVATLD